MESEKLHMNFTCDDSSVTIRHGKADPLPVPKRIELAGVLSSPAEWLDQKRKADYNFTTYYCHAIANREELWLQLVTNDEHESFGGHTITGRLEVARDLKELRINTQSKMSVKQLIQLLKMNRSLFADRDDNLAIVTSLQRFKAVVTQEVEKNDDLRGNKLHHFEQRVSSEFNLSFKLAMPVYKGLEPSMFCVEILFDVTDGSVVYWLESVELKDLQDTVRDQVFNAAIARLREHDITVIEQ
jgi:hypothetical protein